MAFPPFTNQAAWSSEKVQDVKSKDLFFSPESQMRLKVIIRTSIKFASAKSEKKMFEANSVDSVLIFSCVQ